LQGANLKQADVYHLALGDVILDGCRGIVKNVEHVLLSDEGKYDQVVAQLGCKRDRIYHVEYEDAEGRFLTQIEEETLLEERDTFWEIQIKCRATTNNGEEVTRSEERRDTTWEVQCRLRATTRNGVVEVQSCSLDFALAELRETMGEKAWFRICRQCRFGLYHPFQGQGLSCLKRVPEVADQVARLGKSVPLEVLQYFDKVAVGPLDTCKDFEHRTIHSADEDD
jgi:heat shock protein HspQ